MRLIDADDLFQRVDMLCDGCENFSQVKCATCYVDDCISIIDDAKTIDAEQITRCKDCKHWRNVGKEEKCCAMWYAFRTENDFCSSAERRE